MSVAKCLGVHDLDAPNMRELRAEWLRWRQMSNDLPEVDDLKDLPRWMQNAEPTRRDEVLTALRRIAEGDRRAYVALAWLLMPGAARVAGRIHRFADEIDEVVAGQLWIQICDHNPDDGTYVAKKILDRTYRELWPNSESAISPSDATSVGNDGAGRRPRRVHPSRSRGRRGGTQGGAR